MTEPALLGNESLLQQVQTLLRRERLPQCLLLTGPEGAGKSTLAGVLTAALLCTQPREGWPCGQCAECRRVAAGIHPDVITVDYARFGKEKHYSGQAAYLRGEVSVGAAVRPHQGRRKVYHLPAADDLNPTAQNALLKVIEEPPEYVVFLMESRNPALLLPTVRSRATELRLEPLSAATLTRALAARLPETPAEARATAVARCGGWLGQALTLAEEGAACPEAEAILQALRQPNPRAALLRACVPLERWPRDRLQPVLLRLRAGLTRALAVRSGAPGEAADRQLAEALPAAALAEGAEAVQLALTRLQANVSAAHVMGALSVALAALSAP